MKRLVPGFKSLVLIVNFLYATNPVSSDTSFTFLEDYSKIFTSTDIPFFDLDDDSFAGILIVSLETNGDLEYNGVDVTINQTITNINQL